LDKGLDSVDVPGVNTDAVLVQWQSRGFGFVVAQTSSLERRRTDTHVAELYPLRWNLDLESHAPWYVEAMCKRKH